MAAITRAHDGCLAPESGRALFVGIALEDAEAWQVLQCLPEQPDFQSLGGISITADHQAGAP